MQQKSERVFSNEKCHTLRWRYRRQTIISPDFYFLELQRVNKSDFQKIWFMMPDIGGLILSIQQNLNTSTCYATCIECWQVICPIERHKNYLDLSKFLYISRNDDELSLNWLITRTKCLNQSVCEFWNFWNSFRVYVNYGTFLKFYFFLIQIQFWSGAFR